MQWRRWGCWSTAWPPTSSTTWSLCRKSSWRSVWRFCLFILFYIFLYVGGVHSLTTDLLNHLVFVQKVFMKVSMVMFWFDLFYIFLYVGGVHSLTTDLLNHLVFVQKVFMKVSMVIFWFDLFYIFLYVGDVYSLTTNLLNHLVFVQKVFMKVHMVIVLIFSKILSSSFLFLFLHWWCCWQEFFLCDVNNNDNAQS